MEVLRICDRFGCLPSAALAEPSETLRMIELERLFKHGDEE